MVAILHEGYLSGGTGCQVLAVHVSSRHGLALGRVRPFDSVIFNLAGAGCQRVYCLLCDSFCELTKKILKALKFLLQAV